MENHSKHITFRVAVLLLAFTLVLPSLVKLAHALQHDHEHEICIEKNQVHFHNVEYDCEFYKFNVNQNLFLQHYVYDVSDTIENSSSQTVYYSFLKSHQQRASYLRGPPLF